LGDELGDTMSGDDGELVGEDLKGIEAGATGTETDEEAIGVDVD
jgi:hypothetical protein